MPVRNNTEYAIVDIETTGGNARGSRITEIAILIHDGHQVTQQWESLVNPEQEIPPAIFALTGIDDHLVSDAPIFDDIAAQVYALLEGRVFVAHNVNFDYSFVRHQLEESGYRWSAKKLCTVRMARKICPHLPSYSLGRLCDSLSIPLSMRHRAGGDAEATAILFGRLLDWDQNGVIKDMLSNVSPDQRLPPHLDKSEFEQLPQIPGVYYFHDRSGKVIYVGKAVNIKKRVASHFTGHNIHAQRQNFLRHIFHISYEICATELMALLLECAEIKRLWPAYNRALKRFEPKFGIYTYTGQDGYAYICIGRTVRHCPSIVEFNRELDGIRTLQKVATAFQIDYNYCRFGQATVSHPVHSPVDVLPPNRDEHNARIAEAAEHLRREQLSFYFFDKGRTVDEKSCIWVERGLFYGMGYLDSTSQLVDPADIKQSLQRFSSNQYMVQLVLDHIQQYGKQVHYFDPSELHTMHADISYSLEDQRYGGLFSRMD